MLNGKFFTGLPPKMIDRSNTGQNRMQSHFFWPDDTKVDSAVETRGKRRGSFNNEPTAKPNHQQPTTPTDDVDTKGRFHKEFAKSSIQFYDTIQEENGNASHHRKPNSRGLRQEISPKPTAMKLELPQSVIDEEYTAAKKKQVYNSKIQFYDYADEGLNNRSTARKPKMDMNDKKDVERNTKNSPKLQVKRDVRNINVEQRRDNNWIESTPERSIGNGAASTSSRSQRKLNFDESEDRDRQPSRFSRTNHFDNQSYDIEEDSPQRNTEPRLPKKILKTTDRRHDDYNDRIDYSVTDDVGDQINYIANDMRKLRMNAAPMKHVTYKDEPYDSLGEDMPSSSHHHIERVTYQIEGANQNSRIKTPTNRTGSNLNQQRQQRRINNSAYERANEAEYQYMESGNDTFDYDNTRNNNRINNNNNSIKNNNTSNNIDRIITPKSASSNQTSNRPPTTPTLSTKATRAAVAAIAGSDQADDHFSPVNIKQKHLRSSLCFYDGAIVAESQPPTSTTRRNARSSASTRRVSVGLPD